MSKNEFTSIDQFLSQYTGEWGPSDGHWYGLDFSWNGCKYRFHTGAMYESEPLTLPDGRDADFGVYRKLDNPVGGHEYELHPGILAQLAPERQLKPRRTGGFAVPEYSRW